MKKYIITTTLIILSVLFCTAQKRIVLKESLNGYRYYQNGKKLKMKQIVSTLQTNKEAFVLITKSKNNKTIENITGVVGGFLMGYTLGESFNKSLNVELFGIGVAFSGVSIALRSKSKKQKKQAIKIYNENRINKTTYNKKYDLIFTSNGIGFNYTF